MNLGYSDRLHLGQINCDAWRLLVLLPRTGLSGPGPHADSNLSAPFLYLPSFSLMLSVSGYWKVIDCRKWKSGHLGCGYYQSVRDSHPL